MDLEYLYHSGTMKNVSRISWNLSGGSEITLGLFLLFDQIYTRIGKKKMLKTLAINFFLLYCVENKIILTRWFLLFTRTTHWLHRSSYVGSSLQWQSWPLSLDLDLQLPMLSVPITTDVVSWNPDQGEVSNIMW
jgi:hypothetical protein